MAKSTAVEAAPISAAPGYVPESWDDVIAAIKEAGGDVTLIEDQWDLLKESDKDLLVGIPFMIFDFNLNPEGDYGEWATVRLVTENPLPGHNKVRYVFNDGSTGVKEQLKTILAETNQRGGVMVAKGLRKSEYKYIDPFDNKEKPAATFYLAG